MKNRLKTAAINSFAPISETPVDQPATWFDVVKAIWAAVVSSGLATSLIVWLAAIPLDSKPAAFAFMVQAAIFFLRNLVSMTQTGSTP